MSRLRFLGFSGFRGLAGQERLDYGAWAWLKRMDGRIRMVQSLGGIVRFHGRITIVRIEVAWDTEVHQTLTF